MPPGFTFLWPNIDLWRPLRLDRETVQLGNFFHMGVAGVADGFTLEQAEAELGAMTSDLRAVFPDQNAAPTLAEAGFRPVIVSAREHLVGDMGATLWILLAAVGFLLLIACANVANLFLVKSDARYNEFAIRFALGARRGHLAGSVFLESMALGLAGGLVSVPLSLLAVRLLVRWGPRELPRLQEISVDSSVLAFGVSCIPSFCRASDDAEDIAIHPLFHQHAPERLHQRTNPPRLGRWWYASTPGASSVRLQLIRACQRAEQQQAVPPVGRDTCIDDSPSVFDVRKPASIPQRAVANQHPFAGDTTVRPSSDRYAHDSAHRPLVHVGARPPSPRTPAGANPRGGHAPCPRGSSHRRPHAAESRIRSPTPSQRVALQSPV